MLNLQIIQGFDNEVQINIILMRYKFLILLVLVTPKLMAQELEHVVRKEITINPVLKSPIVDGSLDDESWNYAKVASDFIESEPQNGKVVPDSFATEVKIVYDKLGIYFGVTMTDLEPEKIGKELTERDVVNADDYFSIFLNGYNDRQESMEFAVTAAGVQYDSKVINGIRDNTWNAVWHSEVNINNEGWVAEIFVPYFILRFPQKQKQVWGLNMERRVLRTNTTYTWNHIDNTKGNPSLYDGEIHGVENIRTPTRLSFQPYISAYSNSYDNVTKLNLNGGLDIKYGITDAFTLDMILIPDFSQARFDDNVLNLSAFEVQFAEQRPFFNEGTDLFSRGDLFYSRRIGGRPSSIPELQKDEVIEFQPNRVDLVNASKVSGRSDHGLGIGVFNAVTNEAFAQIRNLKSNERRLEKVEPFANYNLMVLDQRYRDNSSVSFVNTNVTRLGNFRDANVTGIYLNHTNNDNTFVFQSSAEGSWVFEDEETKFGAELIASAAKISGKHRFGTEVALQTLEYNINDLGFSANTNYVSYIAKYTFRYLLPKGNLNNMLIDLELNHVRRLKSDLYNHFTLRTVSRITTKEFFRMGGGVIIRPYKENDFYEPRVHGRHVQLPGFHDQGIWIKTDNRKKLNIFGFVALKNYFEKEEII